jgi:hypothetical protein
VPVLVGKCIGVSSATFPPSAGATQTMLILMTLGSFGDGFTTLGGGPAGAQQPIQSVAIGEVFANANISKPGQVTTATGTLAQANTLNGSMAAGVISQVVVEPESNPQTIYAGRLVLTHAQWNAVIDGGAAGGLPPEMFITYPLPLPAICLRQ